MARFAPVVFGNPAGAPAHMPAPPGLHPGNPLGGFSTDDLAAYVSRRGWAAALGCLVLLTVVA